MARFANGKAPFLRISEQANQGTSVIMRDFIIGLVPVILFAWIKNGLLVFINGDTDILGMLFPLFFILMGAISSMTMEAIFFYITDKDARSVKPLMKKLSTSYAVIPGLILALMLPMYTPIWILMFGTFMGNIVAKMLFGGFGNNIFNPALIGYVVIKFSLMGIVNAAGGYLNGSEILVDAYAGATPLSMFSVDKILTYDAMVVPYGSLWSFFLGTVPGGLGETSALALLITYIWLSFRKVIKWFTPLVYVGTVFVLSWIIGAIVGDAGLWFPVYSVFSGGLMFGAVLMITEPVTTPKNPLGKVYLGLMLGVLTVLFRYVGELPEGVASSIFVMNIFAMPVDKYTAIIRANRWRKPVWGKVALLSALLLVIGFYAVFKAGKLYTLLLPVIHIGGLI